MNISEMYTIAVYEVLGEETHKYSSTKVTGGGGYVSTTGNRVHGHTESVRSVTEYHSDQQVWVKDIESGKERQFQFTTYNIAVRPGHRVICAWNNETDKLERIVNLNTGAINHANGYYNSTSIIDKSAAVLGSLLASFYYSIPFLSVIAVVEVAATYKKPNKKTGVKPTSNEISYFQKLVLAYGLNHAIFIYRLFYGDALSAFITFAVVSVIMAVTNAIFLPRVISEKNQLLKAHIDALDSYLREYAVRSRASLVEPGQVA